MDKCDFSLKQEKAMQFFLQINAKMWHKQYTEGNESDLEG